MGSPEIEKGNITVQTPTSYRKFHSFEKNRFDTQEDCKVAEHGESVIFFPVAELARVQKMRNQPYSHLNSCEFSYDFAVFAKKIRPSPWSA